MKHGSDNVEWQLAKKTMKQIRRLLVANKRKLILEQLELNKDDPKKFWAVVNSIWKGVECYTNMFLIDDDGNSVDPDQTANFVNKYYTEIGPNLASKFVGHVDVDPPVVPPGEVFNITPVYC